MSPFLPGGSIDCNGGEKEITRVYVMMSCHATCATTFSSTRLFNFLFFLSYLPAWVSLGGMFFLFFFWRKRKIEEEEEEIWNRSTGGLLLPRWPTIWNRAALLLVLLFFYIFIFFFLFCVTEEKRGAGKMTVKWPPPPPTPLPPVQLEGTTEQAIAGWSYTNSPLVVTSSSSFIQAASVCVCVCSSTS